MTFLIDTNIWLERLLDQDRSVEVGKFFSSIPSNQFAISDFSLHSIGVILDKLKKSGIFLRFLDDVFMHGKVSLLSLSPNDLPEVMKAMHRYKIDFDDAYQCVIAEKYDLSIISFDKDLDRTGRGKKTPRQITG